MRKQALFSAPSKHGNRLSLSFLCAVYLFLIPFLHKTLLYGLPLLEPYALFPLASLVSWSKGFDLVRFEIVSDLLFTSGFLFVLGGWFFVFQKVSEKTLQRLLIFVVSAGVYIFAVTMAHQFGR